MLGTLVWVHYMNLNFYITFVITFNVLTLLEGIWPVVIKNLHQLSPNVFTQNKLRKKIKVGVD